MGVYFRGLFLGCVFFRGVYGGVDLGVYIIGDVFWKGVSIKGGILIIKKKNTHKLLNSQFSL